MAVHPRLAVGPALRPGRSPSPTDAPREDLLRLDLQASVRWRFTARYMHKSDTQRQPYGLIFAGAGSNDLDPVDTRDCIPLVPGRSLLVGLPRRMAVL